MNIRLLIKILGGFWISLSVILLVPSFFSYIEHDKFTPAFLSVSVFTFLVGSLFWFTNRQYHSDINIKTTFAFVTACWVSACLIGAMPYYLSYTLPNFTDSFFESCSGFTGTGASVLTNIEAVDEAILLWRSMTQWLGGIGIIIFFIALLPLLKVGGVQVFKAESTGPSAEKIAPRIKDTARRVWVIYIGFTIFLTFILYYVGMSWYDAINHALTTMSTGGFSTKNAGVSAFNSATIDYIISLFMFIASINFALHYRWLLLKFNKSLFTTELKYYVGIIIGSISVICLIDYLNGADIERSLREATFTVVATISSTGFTNIDYLTWPVIAHWILLLLMIMGGMSGSTAGGIKCIRFVSAFKLLKKELRQTLHPQAVLGVKMNERVIEDKIANAIWGFLFLYFFIFAIITFIISLEGIDLVTSSTTTISALSNIGPAFGSIGPFDNYSGLSYVSKYTLCAGMLLGRLELLTILVLFTRDYWRKY